MSKIKNIYFYTTCIYKHTFIIYFLLLTSTISSCKKDIPKQQQDQIITNTSNGKVYVMCEGNYMAANASITQLNLASGVITHDIYKTANNNAQIGDVVQSMYLQNGNFYIVINNSGKIVVVSKYSFVNTTTISGLTSPRYFLPISSNTAYVSDLYANAISVIDLSTNTKTSSIALKGWSEQMLLSFGNVFVTNKKTNYVYIVNTLSNILTDSINVGYGSSSICEDYNGKLWVLSEGNSTLNIKASLTKINPITKTIDTSFVFPTQTNAPFKMKINAAKSKLFFIDYNGIYQMDVSATALPSSAIIAQGTKVFYGLGIDPQDETIYVADAIDYSQNGKIYRYRANGTALDSFLTGIIPTDFYFDK